MKAAAAIIKFIGLPGHNSDMNYHKAPVAEIKNFKQACTPEEWQEFGRQACEAMGETFEE